MYKNPFDGARAKVSRAEKHYNELIRAELEFKKQSPLRLELEPEENGDIRVMATAGGLPSTSHRAIVADIATNLRASLDIATIQACIVRGQANQKLLNKTYFAFGGDEADWWRNVEQKHSRMAGADEVIRKVVASFKPWAKDGNRMLYALSKIAADDKHVDLVPITMAAEKMKLPVSLSGGDPAKIRFPLPRPIWGGDKRLELFVVTHPTKIEITGPPVFETEFGFGDNYSLYGEPVVATLSHMGAMCQQIIQALEATSSI